MRRRTLAPIAALLLLALVGLPAIALAAGQLVTLNGTLPGGWDPPKWDSATDPYWKGIYLKSETEADGFTVESASVGALRWEGQTFKSLDAFLGGMDPRRVDEPQAPANSQDGSAGFTERTEVGPDAKSGTVEIAGVKFWFLTYHFTSFVDEGLATGEEDFSKGYAGHYYANLPDGSSVTLEVSAYARKGYYDGLSRVEAEAKKVWSQLEFDFGAGGGTSGGGGPAPGGLPWKGALGGLAAVAAAAAALAGAAAARTGKRTKIDKNMPVGYVLQVSADKIRLSSANSAALDVAVWKVLASGAFEPAPDAAITLAAPPGVSVSTPSGTRQLSASVWQTEGFEESRELTVTARAGTGGTSRTIALEPEATTGLTLVTVPAGARLRPTGRDTVMVAAKITAAPGDQVEAAARQSIAFGQPTSAEWLDVGEARDTVDGKELPVSISTPDSDKHLTPPESVTVSATAQIGQRKVTASVTIEVERPPSVDCRPDTVEFSVNTAAETEVMAWIENPGGVEWAFSAKWKEGDRPLTTFTIDRTSPSTVTLRLVEDAAKLPEIGRPQEVSTLVVRGGAEGWDPLDRYLKVAVTREGLFVDATGRDPDGSFHIEARGEGRPTDIDVRVFVRDESGAVRPDPQLAQAVEWAPAGAERSAGRAALGFPEFALVPQGLRGVENPSATFRATMGRKLPTGPEPLDAVLRATVPGFDRPEYGSDVALKFLGVDTSPYSDTWKLERDRCLEIIAEYAPSDLQQRFRDLVYGKGPLMGAEGLYEMRKRIWSISEDALRKEADDYLTKAWALEQVEGVLDWTSYLGDIAFAVASGRIAGTVGTMGIGLLKPMLVSAMTAYVDGKDLVWWAKEQVVLGISIGEGALTDPDFVAKLSGQNKAVVWVAFTCYTCVKEWALDPDHSIRNAMLNTLRMLRDEAIIGFLRLVTGGTPGATKPGAQVPPPPKATKAPTPKPARTPPAPSAAPVPGSVIKPKARPPATPPAPAGAGRPGPKPAPATPAPPAPGSVVKPGPNAKKQTSPAGPAKRAPEFEAPTAKDRARKIGDAVKAKAKPGPKGPQVDADTMEKIMRDPDAARELKRSDPEAWKAYDNARRQVYEAHDRQLEGWIAKNVPEADGQRVEVRSVGTPDGVDRDYRAGIVKTDPATGKQTFVEIPKEKWAGKSQEIFSTATGGPKDPAKAADWAKQHQQLATDGYHAEASMDMADQAMVKNAKTGQWEKSQVTPNLELVKKGKSTLMDPDGLGKTYETKVANSYHEGAPLDAYTQAEKAAHSFIEVKTGYMAQDYKMKPTPPEIIKGFQIIEDVAAGKMTPEAGDAALGAAGVGSNLPEFMGRLSGQFAAFRFAGK